MTFTTRRARLQQLNAVLPIIVQEELPFPVIFSNEDNGFDVVWDTPMGRVTLYIGEVYEIEIVPVGDLTPVQTEDAEQAVRYVKDYYVHKLSGDFMAEFLEELENNRREVARRRKEKNSKK